VETVNDFHFAMMNDFERNDFYRDSLAKAITPDSIVLEIGCGSGLLSIIAASLGARQVFAIEANCHLAQLARNIIAANGYEDKVTVINKLSTEVELEEIGGAGADVLVSEILGTVMLGESALEYVSDARERLIKPEAAIIPHSGRQYATLVSSEEIQRITAVKGWGGIDLSYFNMLQDTTSLVFTKQYGFRFSSIPSDLLSEAVCVADIDFTTDCPGDLEPTVFFTPKIVADGVAHAVMCHWEVYGDSEKTLRMSTDPKETNFPRDMQWGQALQLVEDNGAPETDSGQPVPFVVTTGSDDVKMTVHFSHDNVLMQYLLEHTTA